MDWFTASQIGWGAWLKLWSHPMAKAPKMSPAKDDRLDRKAGIKEGSKKDNALDKARGVPVKKK